MTDIEITHEVVEVEVATSGIQGQQGVVGPQGDQGVQGDKGDPGGWVAAASVANGVDLNTLITPGTYYNGSGTGTAVLNYPADGWAGYIEVVSPAANTVMQRATGVTSGSGTNSYARTVFFRTRVGGTWQPWYRVDPEAHTLAGDPHPAYVKKDGSSVMTGLVNVQRAASGVHGVFQRGDGTVDARRWELFLDTDGSCYFRATTDAGALQAIPARFNRDGSVSLAGSLAAAGTNLTGQINVDRTGTAVVLRGIRTDAPTDSKRMTMGVGVTGDISIAATNDSESVNANSLVLRRAGGVELNGIHHHKGTGSPEGVVTAPVGSRYVDIAATNGAVEWIKAVGAGNTGWKVVYGDTGWRDIPFLTTGTGGSSDVAPNLDPAFSNRIYMRRVNETVELQVSCRFLTPVHWARIVLPPAGFQVDSKLESGAQDTEIGLPIPHAFKNGSSTSFQMTYNGWGVTYNGGMTAPVNVRGWATWPTTQTWPTTLPGVAA